MMAYTPLRFFQSGRKPPEPVVSGEDVDGVQPSEVREETPSSVVPVEDDTPGLSRPSPLPDPDFSETDSPSTSDSSSSVSDDHKHSTDVRARRKKKKKKKPTRKRDIKNLPKIDFSKLVTLSLSNFCEFKESIKTIGYARCWPEKFSSPKSSDLKTCDSTYFDDEVRKEAFLVIYQMIPASLLYLVKNIPKGEVLLLWKTLYNRFLFVTPQTLKLMRKEWEMLSMGSLKVDQFISLVCEKAEALRMVGVRVSDMDQSTAFLCGLDDKYDWVRNFFSLMEENQFTFEDVCKEALKFASNHNLFRRDVVRDSPKDVKTKKVCFSYNSEKGCTRKNCPFPHKKISKDLLAKLKAKQETTAGERTKREKEKEKVLSVREIVCYKCGEKGHIAPKCPHRDLIGKAVQQALKQTKGGLYVAEKGPPQEKKKFLFPLFNVSSLGRKDLILDSGASQHVVNDFLLLTDARPLAAGEFSFTVGNNQSLRAEQVGDLDFGGGKLQGVYYCPECPINLVSEAKLVSAGADVVKKGNTRVAYVVKDDVVVMEANMRDGLFFVEKVVDQNMVLQKYVSRYC